MADWQTDWSHDVLERIVVLLFALAGLADRAAGASFLRRRRVNEILARGEVEARAFVIATICGEPVAVDAPEPGDDAAHLAVRLRALALFLCLMLTWWPARPQAGGARALADPRTDRQRLAASACRHAAAPAPDTS